MAQTNYLGTVFVADKTTPGNQLTVNSDGSINTTATGGGGTAQGAATAGVTGGLDLTSTTTAAPTFVTATVNPLSTDVHGGLRSLVQDSGGTPLDYTQPVQVYQSNSYVNITSNTTTVVKSGTGTLVAITVNNVGTTEVLTIYDNTAGSGTKIGTVSVGTSLATLTYNLAFATGLTIVSSGAGTGDWTVIYR